MSDDDAKTLADLKTVLDGMEYNDWPNEARTVRNTFSLLERQADEIDKLTLRWSSDRPTVPGWYRSRTTCETQAESVHYITKQFIKSAEGVPGHWFDDHQFAGPIATPLEPDQKGGN